MRVICEDCVASGCVDWEKFQGIRVSGKCGCECHKIKAELVVNEEE